MAQNEKSGSDLDIFEGLGKKAPSVHPPNGTRSVPPPPPPAAGAAVRRQADAPRRHRANGPGRRGDAPSGSPSRLPPLPAAGRDPPTSRPRARGFPSIPPPPSPSDDEARERQRRARSRHGLGRGGRGDAYLRRGRRIDEDLRRRGRPGHQDRRSDPGDRGSAAVGHPGAEGNAPRAHGAAPHLERSPAHAAGDASAPAPARVGRRHGLPDVAVVGSSELSSSARDQPLSARPGDHRASAWSNNPHSRTLPPSGPPGFGNMPIPRPAAVPDFQPSQRRAMEATAMVRPPQNR